MSNIYQSNNNINKQKKNKSNTTFANHNEFNQLLSDKLATNPHQLLIIYLYNYLVSNNLNDSANALLEECLQSNKSYLPKNINTDIDQQTDPNLLNDWFQMLWSVQSSINGNMNQVLTSNGQFPSSFVPPPPISSVEIPPPPPQQLLIQQRIMLQQQQQEQLKKHLQQQQQEQIQSQPQPQPPQQQKVTQKKGATKEKKPSIAKNRVNSTPNIKPSIPDQNQPQQRLQQLKLQFQLQQQQQAQSQSAPTTAGSSATTPQNPMQRNSSKNTTSAVDPEFNIQSIDDYQANLLQLENQNNLQYQRFFQQQQQPQLPESRMQIQQPQASIIQPSEERNGFDTMFTAMPFAIPQQTQPSNPISTSKSESNGVQYDAYFANELLFDDEPFKDDLKQTQPTPSQQYNMSKTSQAPHDRSFSINSVNDVNEHNVGETIGADWFNSMGSGPGFG